ncbi:TNF receptor-associated factor homolog 1a-like isoform X4 [Lycium barbarum]|nr:TNF receptor-associated factor homolog 1a-like isoform X4 [Lycium barbarum]
MGSRGANLVKHWRNGGTVSSWKMELHQHHLHIGTVMTTMMVRLNRLSYMENIPGRLISFHILTRENFGVMLLRLAATNDTLHRFWMKELDWGWKKFMELSKVVDGFIDADTLVIKAQIQVIRERAERPFHCLDCQYRRELVRVYLTNVEQICRRFVEERRAKLGKLIEDKTRWSSFCAFWMGIDKNSRRRMSREKSDRILKMVVKNFFIEKE